MADVEQQYRDNGIKVPFVSNDISPGGNFAPGTGSGAVDIYGHDGYPLGFDCANPSSWGNTSLPTNWFDLHESQSPSTPYTVSEFQGGSLGVWGDTGYENCAALLGPEFERVFYKNLYGANIGIMNLYMSYGG
jgi:Glycosyl hydrolases family 35